LIKKEHWNREDWITTVNSRQGKVLLLTTLSRPASCPAFHTQNG
jgi:hypothetical protein